MIDRGRPIPFTGPLVCAILDGRKTVTRRLMRTQPRERDRRRGGWDIPNRDGVSAFPFWDGTGDVADTRHTLLPLCPYGVPGERLWVKEAIARDGEPYGEERWCTSHFIADGAPTLADAWPWKPKMLPGMYCPRGLSRITLEIISVRVERLQDITEEDARAEGVTPVPYDPEGDCWADGKHTTAFEHAWGQLHGFHGERRTKDGTSWVDNPWVWVISFRRLTP